MKRLKLTFTIKEGKEELLPARPKVDTLIRHISIIMCSMKLKAMSCLVIIYKLQNTVGNHHKIFRDDNIRCGLMPLALYNQDNFGHKNPPVNAGVVDRHTYCSV